MGILADVWAAISDFQTTHQALMTWFSSLVSGGVVLRAFLSYWKRPIICVRLDNTLGSYGSVPLTLKYCKDSKLFEEEREGRYLRLRVENTGRTTIKDCSGHLQGIRTQIGSQVANLDSEVVPRGWANFDQKKRDIPPRAHFYIDVATLVLSLDRTSSELHWQEVPTTLVQYFRSIPGRATHTFEIRIDADNAHQRTVPAKFTFDPASSDLTSIIPFNTRYPGWRLRWWLRSRRSHRKWRPALCPVERRPHSDGPP
jgi:hypothetical protein